MTIHRRFADRDSRAVAVSLPSTAEPVGSSPEFTQDTVPEALLSQHQTGTGRWAVLEVIAGQLRFVDLVTDETIAVPEGDQITIRPEAPHRVALDGDVRFQLSFYRA